MDQLAFYPRPTNHYVAGQWFQWWGNYNAIPEYIDGGILLHDVCYPRPVSGACHDNPEGNNSSQGYIRWGEPYIAGIYQRVSNVEPCSLYTFEVYNRNDAWNYFPKIGIEPTGWIITRMGNSPPDNCPPDGASRCPDPYVGDEYDFPSTMTWSETFDHEPYTWMSQTLTVEALADQVSVWTSAAPDSSSGPSYSTYWDYASLVQTPFPDDRLPAPDSWAAGDFITGTQAQPGTNTVVVNWFTAQPASSQVWYTVRSSSSVVPAPEPYSHTVYLPYVTHQKHPSEFELATAPDLTPKTEHSVTVTGLSSGDTLIFVVLSRYTDGTACRTAVGGPYTVGPLP